jgi:hypothetical protein
MVTSKKKERKKKWKLNGLEHLMCSSHWVLESELALTEQ